MSVAGAGTAAMNPPAVGDPMDMDPDDHDPANGDGDGDPANNVPPLEPAPQGGNRDTTTVPSTAFAGAYRSVFTIDEPDKLNREIMLCLANVNCGYLSNPNQAPTLLELKQHTQSLAVLIKQITISTQPAIINNAAATDNDRFLDGESFDFMNNLNVRYINADRHHNIPLNRLMNRLEIDPMDPGMGNRQICPLYEAHGDAADQRPQMHPSQHSLPFAQHQGLIEHANATLELLDHEYSAKGGLLAILPTQDQKEDRAKAEMTLLGQLILYINRLVLRLHDLERLYANAMDVMAGEALVPHQTLNLLGPKGRKEREVVYPQDRFVLANAGDDVWNFLQREFQQKEIIEKRKDAENRRMGVTGEMIWDVKDGTEVSRGMVAIDIVTRYYRVRGDTLKTVFVIPAHQEHPNTRVTREMEHKPTVVSVVKPIHPDRVSMWEQKNREKLVRLAAAEQAERVARDQKELDDARILGLGLELETCNRKIREQEAALKDANTKLTMPINKQRLALLTEEVITNNAMRESAIANLSDAERQKEENTAAKVTQDAANAAYKARLDEREANIKRNEDACATRMTQINATDQDVARAAQETTAKLKAVWTKQVAETQEVVLLLNSQEAQQLLKDLKVTQAIRDQAARDAAILVDVALGT